MTPGARERTTLEIDRRANAWPVVHAEALDVKNGEASTAARRMAEKALGRAGLQSTGLARSISRALVDDLLGIVLVLVDRIAVAVLDLKIKVTLLLRQLMVKKD